MEVRMTSLKEAQVITTLKFGYNSLIHLSAGAVDQGGQAAFGAVGKADWLDAEAVATRINVVYVCALAKVLMRAAGGGLAAEFTVKKTQWHCGGKIAAGKLGGDSPVAGVSLDTQSVDTALDASPAVLAPITAAKCYNNTVREGGPNNCSKAVSMVNEKARMGGERRENRTGKQ